VYQTWPACVRIVLRSTAYCFRRGHRLRLQISSGAFPRFSRNPGTGDPLAQATGLRQANQRVFHDPAHPSRLRLHESSTLGPQLL
jgi:predicted acyl esterase